VTLQEIAEPFIAMAHRIVWASVAGVDGAGRPRSRVLHPIWEWDGANLRGFILTSPTPIKRAHLEMTPNLSVNYWDPSQDTCVAECQASLQSDDETRTRVWEMFKSAPAPVGYDPSMIPVWEGPTSPAVAVLELTPWRLRVFPGTMLLRGAGDVLTWSA
jgi:hypothetical protein